MVRNNIVDVDLCGNVVSTYYNNKEKIMKLVDNNVAFTQGTLEKLKAGEL